jgi:hypothetical protein
MSLSIITVENIKTIIVKKFYKQPRTDGTFGCIEETMGGACGTNGSR